MIKQGQRRLILKDNQEVKEMVNIIMKRSLIQMTFSGLSLEVEHFSKIVSIKEDNKDVNIRISSKE